MEIPRSIKNRGLNSKSTSGSLIKSSSCGRWVVRDSRSGRTIDKSALADSLITRYDKTFRELRNK